MATPTRTSRYGSTPTARPAGTPQAAERSELPRNPGMPLDLGWVRDVRINRSAVERRAATIPTRRSVKTAWQAGWLLRAITLIDLTTLQGDDTPGRALAVVSAERRDRGIGGRGRAGDRHRDHPGARAHGELGGALRRGQGLPRRGRARPRQGDPRHGRPRHAPGSGTGEPRGNDGRRRLHQDLDGQGERQRDPPRGPRHGPADP